MESYDIIVIGGGPAGYPAAAQAAKAGMKTLLVEADSLGGTCLNRGCIPTKTFCRSAAAALEVCRAPEFGVEVARSKADGEFGIGIAQPHPLISLTRIVQRKDAIVLELREAIAGILAGVDIVKGMACFTGAHTITAAGNLYTAPYIIVATGSEPASLPIPGAEHCYDSTRMLESTEMPSVLTVIGGGVIGLEFASVFNAFGCEVHVVEYCREILPGIDREVAKRLRSLMSRRGVKFHPGTEVTAVETLPEADTDHHIQPQMRVLFNEKGKQSYITCNRVLMAVGRRAVIPEGMAEAGAVTGRYLETDDNFLTAIAGVYAVGDVNGRCMLAHAATAQSAAVMHNILKETGRPVPDRAPSLSPVPACVFTDPELAVTGLSQDQAEQQGIPCRAIKIPYRASGKALAMGATDGLVKALVTPDGSRILGASILGAGASSLIMEFSLAISAGLPPSALAAIHPHPTLSELIPGLMAQC